MRTENKYDEIALVYKIDDEFKVEKVYAQKVGDYYQLKSIPAFASNVAYDDIISAEHEGGLLFFEELIKPSGHSVVHVAILKPDASANIFSELASHGVNINYMHDNIYLAIDIPPHISYDKLKFYLDSEFKRGNLDYKESCISDEHSPYK